MSKPDVKGMARATTLVTVLGVIFVLAVRVASGYTGLREYDPALAEDDLLEDVASDQVTLKEVCWFSCYPPGIEDLYFYCYEDVATETIDPTGDAISGQEQLRLKSRAKEYATRYNELALDHFDRTGRRSCPSEEKWTEAFLRTDEYIKKRTTGIARSARRIPSMAASRPICVAHLSLMYL